MAVRREIKYICDMCHEEFPEDTYWDGKLGSKNPKKIKIQHFIGFPVVFLTEQNEGRNCEPYVDFVNLDLCMNCARKALNIEAIGAQGYNHYRFKTDC